MWSRCVVWQKFTDRVRFKLRFLHVSILNALETLPILIGWLLLPSLKPEDDRLATKGFGAETTIFGNPVRWILGIHIRIDLARLSPHPKVSVLGQHGWSNEFRSVSEHFTANPDTKMRKSSGFECSFVSRMLLLFAAVLELYWLVLV